MEKVKIKLNSIQVIVEVRVELGIEKLSTCPATNCVSYGPFGSWQMALTEDLEVLAY